MSASATVAGIVLVSLSCANDPPPEPRFPSEEIAPSERTMRPDYRSIMIADFLMPGGDEGTGYTLEANDGTRFWTRWERHRTATRARESMKSAVESSERSRTVHVIGLDGRTSEGAVLDLPGGEIALIWIDGANVREIRAPRQETVFAYANEELHLVIAP